jgi:RNA polymerase sigma-70 factor (ECF subfamily)
MGPALAFGASFPSRNAGSLSVQRPRRHAARPVSSARCPLTKHEDAASVELREIRAIADGDSAAFQRLIDREAPRLLRFARGLLGNLEEAEDAVQDTFVRLWENAAGWLPEARIGTWLHRVCYNRSIDMLRRRRTFVEDGVLESLPDHTDLPDAQLIESETALSLRDAVENLPPRQRTAILLFHYQDLHQREAAEIMGISEPAFESMLARARRQLKRWLASDTGRNAEGEGGVHE